mgnify:CR=1 FL=1
MIERGAGFDVCKKRPALPEGWLDSRALSPDFEAALMRWHWPGNVRELQNVVSSALIQCTGRLLERQHLPPRIQPAAF